MYRGIFVIAVLLIFCNCFCFSQRKIGTVFKKDNLNYPYITSEPEVLDTSIFTHRGNDTIVRNGKAIARTFYQNSSYWEKDKSGNLLKEVRKWPGKVSTISSYDYSGSLIFGVFKEYNSKGVLVVKGGRCWFGFRYGKWFYYDNDGNLIKSENFDDGYKFGADRILHFCETHSISLKRKSQGYKTHIEKVQTDDGKPAWAIEYYKIDALELIGLQIDAGTGKILKQNISPMPLE